MHRIIKLYEILHLAKYITSFFTGLSVTQAAMFHVSKLGIEDDLSSIANNSINPTQRAIEYLREKWLDKNVGGLDQISMRQCLDKYKAQNPEVLIECDIQDDGSYCVMLLTPFMKRVHTSIREAGEIIFVDATSNCDGLNTAVVPVLCASPAGALPLGFLFLSSQDEAMFTKGKSLPLNLRERSHIRSSQKWPF